MNNACSILTIYKEFEDGNFIDIIKPRIRSMGKTLPMFVLALSSILLSACSSTLANSESLNNESQLEQVTLTFVQHTFLGFSYDDNHENNGYYFSNDELAKTSFKFDKGHNLSPEEIDDFGASSLNYELPNLEGDGYWSFTFFTTSFDEDSGFSGDFLEPCVLDKDLIVHFAIYG